MVDQVAPDDIVEEIGPSTEDLAPGTHLGRYELLLAIAKGGMARVWAARQHGHRGFSKTVAIKTILPHLAEEPEFERMFLDEARIAALVHHPNVCEIYELGEEGKVLYLAMEWVNGESLVHILRSSGKMAPMEPRLCARIIADACAGLHAAHQLTDDMGKPMNVVHRDVSPHNILVGADGNVKVADFGVAKALGQMHSATVAGQVKGKIAYMAPEQIAGGAADRRIDIFAMGVTLYEATTGRRPFTGEGDPQVMHAILSGQFTPPSRIIRGYPPELEQIVLSAMSQDPAGRFGTAERMRMALEEYLARSGPIVSQSNVGAFVHQRVGGVLDRRRDRIRAAANAPGKEDISGGGGAVGGTPSAPQRAIASGVHTRGAGFTPSTGSSAPRVDATGPSIVAAMQQAPQTPSAAKYVLAAAIGVSVVAGLGAVGIVVARNRAMQNVPVAATTAVTVAPPKSAAPPIASVAPVAPTPSPTIELRGLPDEATVRVDGQALAAGIRAVARPAHGAKATLEISAPGFADQTVTLDESTPSSLEVALTLQSPPPQPTATTTTTSTSGSTGPAPTHKVALPANPY
ncbi:MAG TPA: serine/threonine-protein kinase [Polyangiaceae bacterium]|jgi:serine/threonine-protein kinase